jgi:hypothetical protein
MEKFGVGSAKREAHWKVSIRVRSSWMLVGLVGAYRNAEYLLVRQGAFPTEKPENEESGPSQDATALENWASYNETNAVAKQ